jgi:hypothetical protein
MTFIEPPVGLVDLHALRAGRIKPVQRNWADMRQARNGIGRLEENPRKRVSSGNCPKKQESEHDCDDHPGDLMQAIQRNCLHGRHSSSARWLSTCGIVAIHSAPLRFAEQRR